MKFICDQADLLKSITTAGRAIPVRASMQVLECFFIKAYNGEISIIGNDLSLYIITTLNGDVTEEGETCVNAKLFNDIIRRLPEGDISISTDNSNNVFIVSDKSKFNIAARATTEYPGLPNEVYENSFRIFNYDLKEMIKKTIFAVSDNESNKVLASEDFEVNGNQLYVTALDGHRIARVRHELDRDYGKFKALVMSKTLSEIMKILQAEKEDSKETTLISFSEKIIKFENKEAIILSRAVEGKPFNIEQIMAGDYDTVLNINKKEFLDSIERASLLIRDIDRRPVVIGIGQESIEIKISTTLGSMNEIVPVEMEGNEFVIGFNPKFLIDILRVIDDEYIEAKLVNSKAPLKIDAKDESYVYILLPVNIGG